MGDSGRPLGPFGIDPLYFSLTLFGCLILFVLYLLLPRGARVHFFSAYPKRYAWSARPRRRRIPGGGSGSSHATPPVGSVNSASGAHSTASNSFGGFFGRGRGNSHSNSNHNHVVNQMQQHPIISSSEYSRSNGTGMSGHSGIGMGMGMGGGMSMGGGGMEESIEFASIRGGSAAANSRQHQSITGGGSSLNSDEAAVSSAMAQLRNQGVVIVAHGSRGKPKTVRLQLTKDSITWRTETRRKNSSGSHGHSKEIKLGKLHSVALNNIMYVDVGKQTTALRRSENASVPESLCFSLLTKEGSLDLEANSPRERDALVGSFSLVLDDVHAQNWRDIYRASNEMPSSFDEYDEEIGVGPR